MNSWARYSLIIVVFLILPIMLLAEIIEEGSGPGYSQQQNSGYSSQLSRLSETGFVFYKDPFESYLPKETEGVSAISQDKMHDLGPPPVTIEGILWGTDRPMVIIDGEVYGVGDMLQTVEAKVFKIKKNTVFISYGERIYEMNVKTKGVQ